MALRTCPLALPRSQVRPRLGPVGYYRRCGYGGIQTCLAVAHHVAPSKAWYDLASTSTSQDPRKGPSLTRRTMPRHPRRSASSGWLPRGGEFYARFTSQGSANVSHDYQGQASVRRAQRAGFLFGAKEASHRRGVPRSQPKVAILVQQDQDR